MKRLCEDRTIVWPLLVTTADHALLDRAMIDEICNASEGADVAIGVVERSLLHGRFPHSKRTWLKFRGGAYTGTNLFVLRSPKVAGAIELWAAAEQRRKKGWRLILLLGPITLLGNVLLRVLSIEQVLDRVGERLGMSIKAVRLSNPLAGVDVDKMEDHALAEAVTGGPRVTDLAIYDMDRTITRTATYTPFLLHCALHRAPWRLLFLPLVILSMVAYAGRLIDRARLKEINHRLLLGPKIHPGELEPLVESFADKQVATNIRPGARKAIARDRAEGRRIVLATASYRLYANAIARRLSFDDVIGTQSVIGLDEQVHARIAGENCYGEAKMRMIADWVEQFRDLKGAHGHVRFYSDHVSDQPAFEWSDEPVAVNPHRKLRMLAAERGWAIEDWG